MDDEGFLVLSLASEHVAEARVRSRMRRVSRRARDELRRTALQDELRHRAASGAFAAWRANARRRGTARARVNSWRTGRSRRRSDDVPILLS